MFQTGLEFIPWYEQRITIVKFKRRIEVIFPIEQGEHVVLESGSACLGMACHHTIKKKTKLDDIKKSQGASNKLRKST